MINEEVEIFAKDLKESYYDFFMFFWPLISADDYVDAPHIRYICNELQELGQHIINRTKPPYDWYLINIPPGSSKSSMVSVLWPCWLLAHDASVFIISSSYSAGLSQRDVRKSRNIIDSPVFIALFGEVKMAKDTEHHFETAKTGGRYATSTTGTIVGYHGNVFIHDDPLSVEMSYSEAERIRANRFVTETAPQRVRNKEITPQLIIMQRLNEEDPTGYIIERGLNAKHIVLPAELDEITTAPELYQDGLLDPNRMPRQVLIKKRKELGDTAYEGQYGQRPFKKGGNILKSKWFPVINEKEVPGGITWEMWIDGAYTKQTSNDPSGIMIAGFLNHKLYIRYFIEAYMELPDLLEQVKQAASIYDIGAISGVYVEPKASGKSLVQMLYNTGLNMIEIEGHLVGQGKAARAHTAAPTANAGGVILVDGNWNETFLHQLEGFPNAKHDEAIDLLGYAVDHYFVQPEEVPDSVMISDDRVQISNI